MSCNCKSHKYASDYNRIVDLAKKLSNAENMEYWVYQKKDKTYGCDQPEFIPEGRPVQFKAIPRN